MHRSQLFKSVIGLISSGFVTAAIANPAHTKISSLSEADRKVIFSNLLSSSGEKCARASKTFYQGSDKSGNAFWNVSCSGGESFVIQVSSNATGSTRVLNCKVLKSVNGGTCFSKFKS